MLTKDEDKLLWNRKGFVKTLKKRRGTMTEGGVPEYEALLSAKYQAAKEKYNWKLVSDRIALPTAVNKARADMLAKEWDFDALAYYLAIDHLADKAAVYRTVFHDITDLDLQSHTKAESPKNHSTPSSSKRGPLIVASLTAVAAIPVGGYIAKSLLNQYTVPGQSTVDSWNPTQSKWWPFTGKHHPQPPSDTTNHLTAQPSLPSS